MLIVAAAAFLTACTPPAPYAGSPHARKVFLTGDSLAADARDGFVWMGVSDGWAVADKVFGGTDIGWAELQIAGQIVNAAEVGGEPHTIVVAAGTNNWQNGWDAADQQDTEDVLSWAKEVECAVWITPASFKYLGGRRAHDVFGTQAVKAIVATARQAPNVHVARWDLHADGHPEWFRSDDGYHHTEKGRLEYAKFMVEAVRRRCPA